MGVAPDLCTVPGLLLACEGLSASQEGGLVHGLIKKLGSEKDIIVRNVFLSMYWKFDRSIDGRGLKVYFGCIDSWVLSNGFDWRSS